jgi:sugar phosphate isomerase/epimerase
MIIPLSWLREYVDIDIPVEALAERLTNAGLEVAHLTYLGVPQTQVEGLRYPKSDHLVWDRQRILLGAIRETNVGTCLDTGHAFLSRDLRTVVHKLSGHLRMLHVNDNLGDSDTHLSPGEGAIDWISLVRQLRQWNFQGAMILELADSGDCPTCIMQRARDARSYLGEIMERWK